MRRVALAADGEFTWETREIHDPQLLVRARAARRGFPARLSHRSPHAATAHFSPRSPRSLDSGLMLWADYGFARPRLLSPGPHLRHAAHVFQTPAGENPLASPGETDITAHVDFTAVAEAAHRSWRPASSISATKAHGSRKPAANGCSNRKATRSPCHACANSRPSPTPPIWAAVSMFSNFRGNPAPAMLAENPPIAPAFRQTLRNSNSLPRLSSCPGARVGKLSAHCRDGGIGRRARFRFWYRKVCRFESCFRHFLKIYKSPA